MAQIICILKMNNYLLCKGSTKNRKCQENFSKRYKIWEKKPPDLFIMPRAEGRFQWLLPAHQCKYIRRLSVNVPTGPVPT